MPSRPIDKICACCGKSFSNRHKSVIYCSRSCSAEKQKVERLNPACQQCGKSLEHKRHKDIKFCSHKCRAEARKLPSSKCLYCGEPTPKPGMDYCSRSCYDQYRTESRNLCLHCGKRVKGGGNEGGYKYCCHECKVAHLRPHPRPCVNCHTVFTPIKFNTTTKRIVAYNAGKTCSAKCQNEWIRNNPERKKKISEAFKGAKHPNWQGGLTAINISEHRGPDWYIAAALARRRDGHVCVVCGKTKEENGREMDVHHLVSWHKFENKKEANRLSNLVSLCQECHGLVEANERQLAKRAA